MWDALERHQAAWRTVFDELVAALHLEQVTAWIARRLATPTSE